jgi:hypothetical protein
LPVKDHGVEEEHRVFRSKERYLQLRSTLQAEADE